MKKIVFILPNYPEVMSSFLLALSKIVRVDIEIICLKKLLKEREIIYEQNELSKFIKIVFFDEQISFIDFINGIILDNLDSLVVFGGFFGRVGKALKLYHKNGGRNAVVLTEKPSVLPVKNFNKLIRFAKNIKSRCIYSSAYKKVETAIKAILVTGVKGVNQFKSFGIPEEKLYNFMYTHIDEVDLPKITTNNEKVRFVYIGRFNYLNRGIDNLIRAFNKIKLDNWTLDLVGGYGENAKEIISWANNCKNVSYIGAWKSNQVIANMRNYDICISPTRVDGWRIQVNQAIMAGIGTITTEEAISDELIKKSKSGIVVNAFNFNELYDAILYVLSNPSVIDIWKNNASNYKKYISNVKVASYVNKIFEYISFEDIKEKPRCPWL